MTSRVCPGIILGVDTKRRGKGKAMVGATYGASVAPETQVIGRRVLATIIDVVLLGIVTSLFTARLSYLVRATRRLKSFINRSLQLRFSQEDLHIFNRQNCYCINDFCLLLLGFKPFVFNSQNIPIF